MAPRGRFLRDGISCGVCEAEFSLPGPTRAHRRSQADALGFHYVEAWGWVCPGCFHGIPGFREARERRARKGPEGAVPAQHVIPGLLEGLKREENSSGD
jgi:hypothetical protein